MVIDPRTPHAVLASKSGKESRCFHTLADLGRKGVSGQVAASMIFPCSAGKRLSPFFNRDDERRVVNLMDALRASIEADTQKKPAAPSAKTRKAGKRKAVG